VAAAYQRFLGPDSGGIERFFPAGELTQRVDGTLLIVRLRSQKAVSGAAQAVGELNAAVCLAWAGTVSAFQVLALAAGAYLGFARELLHRA
jgi:hypothetical protein